MAEFFTFGDAIIGRAAEIAAEEVFWTSKVAVTTTRDTADAKARNEYAFLGELAIRVTATAG